MNTQLGFARILALTSLLALSSRAQPAPDTAGQLSPQAADTLGELHATNQTEINLGKIAQGRGSDSQVKSFADQMVSDHTQMDQAVEEAAKSHDVSLQQHIPSGAKEEQLSLVNKLAPLRGNAFDQAYMSVMVKGHQAALEKVKADQAEPANRALVSLLRKAEATIQHHLSMAQDWVSHHAAHARTGHTAP
jgi:predicted outer membrane protein